MTPSHRPSPSTSPPGGARPEDGPTSARAPARAPGCASSPWSPPTTRRRASQPRSRPCSPRPACPTEVVVIPNGCTDGTADGRPAVPGDGAGTARGWSTEVRGAQHRVVPVRPDADVVICLDADTVLPANAVGDWEHEFLRDAELRASRASAEDAGAVSAARRGRRTAPLPLGGSSSKFTMLGRRLPRPGCSAPSSPAGPTPRCAAAGPRSSPAPAAAITGEALRADGRPRRPRRTLVLHQPGRGLRAHLPHPRAGLPLPGLPRPCAPTPTP